MPAARLFRDKLRTATRTYVFVLIAWFGMSMVVSAQEPSASRLEHAANEPRNWLTYYGNYGAWSYSALNQINASNVKQLTPAWAFAAGTNFANRSLRPGIEAAPLVLDGVLYLVGMQNNVYAVDAATGKLLWNYIYRWSEEDVPGIKGARGLAIGEGLIFMGTQDAHLVALDAKTGKEVWNVGVDDATKCLCSITSAPLYVRGKIITGIAGGDGPLRGYLKAFDAKTGSLLWNLFTIPEPGEPGSETWSGDSWKTGGVATWLQGSYDPELNFIYWGTGNAFPDLAGDKRSGANLYAASLLAVDADTGEIKWYYQETPHDVYDFDSNMEPVLLDLNQGGRTRKLVLHSSKNGFAYLLDRETGKFLNAFPYVGTANWTSGLDENGKPKEALIPAENNTDRLTCPGTAGGRNFNHSAYSPRTGLWYSSATEFCTRYAPGANLRAGRVVNPDAPPHIGAFDPLTGKQRWTFPTKYINQASLLATSGDLIFGGDMEGYAFALDARTGKKLWSFNTGARIVSSPVSFSVNGRQYVANASGGGAIADTQIAIFWPDTKDRQPQSAATLFVFALPEAGK